MDHADDGDDEDVYVYMGGDQEVPDDPFDVIRIRVHGEIPEHLRHTITHVRVHKSVKVIRLEAFMFCRNLVSIEMHDGVK